MPRIPLRRTYDALIFAAVVLGSSQLAAQDEPGRRVDSAFAEWNRDGSPGLAVAVVRDGRVLLERGYGYASLEHGVRITPQTVFDVASVSKQFAGMAIAMLAQQGRVDLDADVRRYIPEMHRFDRTITVRHLLHHTSGLRDWPGTLAIAGWRFDDVIAFDQILRMAFNQRDLNFVPGAEYTYSNTGYNLLAEIVARVTGESFRTWTEKNLFGPLGMTRSHFHDNHNMVVRDRAAGYLRTPNGWQATTDNLTALGSSSLFSTVGDMARWLMNFDDAKIGGRPVIEMMRTRGRLNDGSTIPYAFGISHGSYRGRANLAHSGSWAGFVSYLIHFPEQRFGVIVLANTSAVPVQRAAFTLADIYLGDVLGPQEPAVVALAGQPAVSVAAERLDQFSGIYRLGPGWYLNIRRDGDMLRTRATREDEFPLSPRSDSVFWVAAYNSPMTFTRDSSGAPVLLYRAIRAPRLGRSQPALRRGSPADLAGEYYSEELQTVYVVDVKDTTVTVRHRRNGDVTLTRAFGDDYASPAWYAASVAFDRDGGGRVIGLTINGGIRVRNVRFTRRR